MIVTVCASFQLLSAADLREGGGGGQYFKTNISY